MTYFLYGVAALHLRARAHRRANIGERAALWRATLEDPLCGAMLVLMRDEVGKDGMVVLDLVGLAAKKIPGATYRR